MLKKLLVVSLFSVSLLSVNAKVYANPGKHLGWEKQKEWKKHEDWNKHNNNWNGYVSPYYRDSRYRDWMGNYPYLRNSDPRRVDDIYRRQLAYERDLRNRFARYSPEISRLPQYRGYRDPLGRFVDDYMYQRNRYNPYDLSPGFRGLLSAEQRRRLEIIRLIQALR